MDMTYEQIEREFIRQVHLCSGIGVERQLEIVARQWKGESKRVGDDPGFVYTVRVEGRFRTEPVA